MAEYITKKQVIEWFSCYGHDDKQIRFEDLSFDIQNMNPEDVAPVVHGRWGRCGGDLHSSGYAIFCSVCNKVHFVHRKYSIGGLTNEELFKKPKYCPSCGAVMECEE